MKRLVTILTVLCLIVPEASAQWYLFPGSPQKKQQQEKAQQQAVQDELRRIHGEAAESLKEAVRDSVASGKTISTDRTEAQQPQEPWAYRPKYSDAQAQETLPEEQQPQEEQLGTSDEAVSQEEAPQFVLDIPETIELAMLLPLKSTGNPSANFLDYYSGALMAVRDLGRKGIRIDLNIYDTTDPSARITDNGLAEADIIIGPVAAKEIEDMLQRCPENKFIVSPLEPKAASLADSCRVIQAPSPTYAQIDEMVKWLSEDARPLDTIILLNDNAIEGDTEEFDRMVQKLQESGLEFSILNELGFNNIDFTKGEVRFLISSSRDSFLCSAVNAIGKLGSNKGNVTLYSTSKLRSMEGINAESMFNARCHMTSNYFIDYTNPDIRKFVLSYRALFQNEPSSFSFHGYDSVTYFVEMCAQYGRQWYLKLPEKVGKGLQADFMFEDLPQKTGTVNSAVRRIVYSPDLSISLK